MENIKLCIQKVNGDKFFLADTILLNDIGIKKDSEHFTIKLFNENMINKLLHA